MKILISVPTGYNARELLLPLKELFEEDHRITKVYIISPGANWRDELWSGFGDKFELITNPDGQSEHDVLVERLAVAVVVTTTNGLDPYDVAILKAAKNNSIPSVTFVASWDNVFKMGRAKSSGRPYANADYFGVWNSVMRDHLLGVFPEVGLEKVEITGAPRFDYFWHNDRIPDKAELIEYLGFKNGQKKLVHCATTELYSFEYIIRGITNDVELSEQHNLYASVHPGGEIKNHERYQKYGVMVKYSFGRREQAPLPEFEYMPSEKDIYMLVALFKHSDILVNQSSTVAIESMIADVPVISVKYGKPWDYWRWRKSMVYRDFNEHYRQIIDEGGTSVVKNKRQLISEIKRYYKNRDYKKEARSRTVTKVITYTDGSAGRRVLDLIRKVV